MGDILALTGLPVHCERQQGSSRRHKANTRQEKLVEMGGENRKGLLVMQLQKVTIHDLGSPGQGIWYYRTNNGIKKDYLLHFPQVGEGVRTCSAWDPSSL